MDHLPVDAYDSYCWDAAVAAGTAHDCDHCRQQFDTSNGWVDGTGSCKCFHCMEWRAKSKQAKGWPDAPPSPAGGG